MVKLYFVIVSLRVNSLLLPLLISLWRNGRRARLKIECLLLESSSLSKDNLFQLAQLVEQRSSKSKVTSSYSCIEYFGCGRAVIAVDCKSMLRLVGQILSTTNKYKVT